MRVTNHMMTANMLSNINKNKLNMSNKFDQYATGQKIQKPSEDPVVAIRSLKYRANLTELLQYYEKNIPDATSWMDVTESALDKMDELLTNMNSYCNQGATDTYEVVDRDSIAQALEQYREQIYQCLNTDYAGRYVFAGYRTDTPILFSKETIEPEYSIEEPLAFANINTMSYIVGGASFTEDATTDDYVNMAPTMKECYRLQLSYDQINDLEKLIVIDEDGEEIDMLSMFSVSQLLSTDTEDGNREFSPYTVESGKINFIKDTGELILSKEAFELLRTAKSMNATYAKNRFNTNDVKPEFYFDCATYMLDEDGERIEESKIDYLNPMDQNINYEVNFGQRLKVNTMANETLTTRLGRQIDEIMKTVNDVYDVQQRIGNVELMIKDTSKNDEEKKALEALKAQLDTELVLKKTIMQNAFGRGITTTKEVQNGQIIATKTGEIHQIGVSVAITSLGSRYKRLQLTEDRLSDQKTSFTEILSNNESVNLEDAIINYNAAEVTYNASLSAAGKVVKNTLLDFI